MEGYAKTDLFWEQCKQNASNRTRTCPYHLNARNMLKGCSGRGLQLASGGVRARRAHMVKYFRAGYANNDVYQSTYL